MTNKTTAEIRERESREEQPHRAIAAATKKPVVFIASDGCEVTVLPNGSVFYNASDWY